MGGPYITILRVQVLRHLKTSSLLVIVLSCPLIGSLSSSTANQRATQNNYYTESGFGVPGFVFLKHCYLYTKSATAADLASLCLDCFSQHFTILTCYFWRKQVHKVNLSKDLFINKIMNLSHLYVKCEFEKLIITIKMERRYDRDFWSIHCID